MLWCRCILIYRLCCLAEQQRMTMHAGKEIIRLFNYWWETGNPVKSTLDSMPQSTSNDLWHDLQAGVSRFSTKHAASRDMAIRAARNIEMSRVMIDGYFQQCHSFCMDFILQSYILEESWKFEGSDRPWMVVILIEYCCLFDCSLRICYNRYLFSRETRLNSVI